MVINDIVVKLNQWGKNKTDKNPYFSDSHKFGSELKERLSYHAEFDVFPDKLINSAAPNEDDKEFRYRKENYKQVTKPVWDKALSKTYRIFNPQNYSIQFSDDDVKDYFLTQYPSIGSFVEMFKDMLHKMKYADPNAVACVKPEEIPGTYETENEEVIFKPDQSALLEPIVELFPADRVFEFKPDWCLVLTKEKSEVSEAQKKVQDGLVFEYYDQMTIYKIVQYGNKSDWTFVAVEYYQHNWEQIPAWRLRGIPTYDPMLYYSHFMCAVPNLDKAAFLDSTAFGVTNKVAFPTRWYFTDECSDCSGRGWTENYETHAHERCGTCMGSGMRFTFTFGKDYKIPMPENNISQDTTQLPTPPFGVVDPPVESIKYLDEKVKYLLDTAFLNLNITVTEQATGVSATEVNIDEDEQISFLMQISSEEFYLMQELFDAQAFMRWNKEDLVTVKKPTEFRIRSSADLTEELKTGIDAKLPSSYLIKLMQENIDQRFQGDKQMQDVTRVVALVDPLMTATDITISSLVSDGSIEKWQKVLHYFVYNFIYLKIEEDPAYLSQDISVIKADLEAMAKAQVPQQNKAAGILNTL